MRHALTAVQWAGGAVAKGIELFHILQPALGLRLHPGAQAGLQRALPGYQRSGGQGNARRLRRVDGQDIGLPRIDRDHDGGQVDAYPTFLWRTVGHSCS